MYSRNCTTRLGKITVAHAVLASNASRLAKTVENALLSTEHLLLDLSHNYDEFLELTFQHAGTDTDVNVVSVYAARGVNDDYIHVASLSLTVGTGIVRGGARLYSEALVATESAKEFELLSSACTANEHVRAYLNTCGYSRFLFIVTTLASTDVAVDVATLSRASIPSVA